MAYLRELTCATMVLRLLLAALCGGLIGIERGKGAHAAGMRTHILVCIGSASVVITSVFFNTTLGFVGDTLRMPAQVISGVGFLGAGSILVTGKRHVSGLTTAAGLWASACMGLAAGAGYYECALVMCAMILVDLVVLHRFDSKLKGERRIDLYMELAPDTPLSSILTALNLEGIQINGMDTFGNVPGVPSYHLDLMIIQKGLTHSDAMDYIATIPGILFIEEIHI